MNPTKPRGDSRSFETRLAKAREMNSTPKLMSVPEAATVIRVGRSKMWQLVWAGDGGWVWLRGDRHDPAHFGHLELGSL